MVYHLPIFAAKAKREILDSGVSREKYYRCCDNFFLPCNPFPYDLPIYHRLAHCAIV